MANVLALLGIEKAWVVHGSDGIDELTTSGPSHVAALENGKVSLFEVTPEEAGLARARPESLKGGDPQHNAQALRGVLDGAPGAYRDIVLLNAGAALIVAGKAGTLHDGAAMAASALDSGAARATLDKLIAITNTPAPMP